MTHTTGPIVAPPAPAAGLRALLFRWLRSALGAALSASLCATLWAPTTAAIAQPPAEPLTWSDLFEQAVPRHLQLPAHAQADYAARLSRALAQDGIAIERAQFVVLVDRSALVQAALLWWVSPENGMTLVGAAPVSTGRPQGFEHFETPLGVFEHALAHPDFRAEGTPNALGIRGYGERGLRVFDFGWITAARGWRQGEQAMRLQLHATDPVWLAPRLGQRDSKGCIRVDADFNRFLDRYAVLDAAYDEALAAGDRLWVLRPDRIATPWSGRWLVVVDSQALRRPDWSPPPAPASRPGPAP